MHIQHIITNI